MKPKTGFESGSSPTATARVAESGALLQTGRGLEEAKRRIMEAFEKIRQPAASQPMLAPTQVPNQPPVQAPVEYTEQHKTRFHERAKRLSLAALETPGIIVFIAFNTANGPAILSFLVDGTHRAVAALRAGRDFFAYVLTPEETRQCMSHIDGKPNPHFIGQQGGVLWDGRGSFIPLPR